MLLSCLGWCFQFYLDMLGKLQQWVSKTVGPSASYESLTHRLTVANLNIYYRYNFSRCSSELAELVPLPHSCGMSTCYSNTLHDFSETIPRSYNQWFLWSLELFTSRMLSFDLTDLNGLKFKVKRQLYIWVLSTLLFYTIFMFFL